MTLVYDFNVLFNQKVSVLLLSSIETLVLEQSTYTVGVKRGKPQKVLGNNTVKNMKSGIVIFPTNESK